ncbi:D-glycero-beta-D-manno-heptose-1,7-bisphosphate 7-phosphatase [Halalkalibacillus sediminis]|uniref:D,D-heptose 1,7-bisphosphate phosphatase n=1 Tax=Halalkalibacillus sediminis TaxID=2018042 RepID=A0A2I0QRA5_9BACI|nr:HAD family hydrolase [Halalkalibacillus sediminis]PKR76866.1 D-glycero-beta-D-manno-heptose-1,7-bisphosphate 7-phosphatase [Halalkalibacillus sediminis]
MHKAVFLDRDGVINEVKTKRVKFVNQPEQFYFLDGVAESIKKLNDHGYEVFVVTNQGGVGLKYMSERTLEEIHDYMVSALEEKGAMITEVKACTHRPDEGCDCRKPEAGMIKDLVKKYDIDIEQSYMIGDREPDIKAGLSAGLKSLMVVGRSTLAYKNFRNLKEAVEWILDN